MKPDKIYLSLVLLLILTTLSWISSCTHDAKLTDFPPVCFDRDVLPVFGPNCAIPRCHDGTGESQLALDNYPDILRTVVPYNPDASPSYKAITATWGENRMPPDQPLSLENRTIIRIWIEQGAFPTTCPDTVLPGSGVKTRLSYLPSINQ
jgi:hypothetical protein